MKWTIIFIAASVFNSAAYAYQWSADGAIIDRCETSSTGSKLVVTSDIDSTLGGSLTVVSLQNTDATLTTVAIDSEKIPVPKKTGYISFGKRVQIKEVGQLYNVQQTTNGIVWGNQNANLSFDGKSVPVVCTLTLFAP